MLSVTKGLKINFMLDSILNRLRLQGRVLLAVQLHEQYRRFVLCVFPMPAFLYLLRM